MKLKHNKVATLAATLITFGSLAGGANAAITFSGDLVAGLTVSVSSSVNFTVDQNAGGLGTIYLGFQDVYTSDQTFDNQSTIVQPITLTLNGGTPVSANSFLHSNVLGEVSPRDFYVGFDFSGQSVSVGDTFVLSSGTATSNPNFDIPDAVGATVELDLFNSNNGNTLTSGAIVSVPEPSSAILLGLGALGVLVRRKRTA
jgi:hypothetical protein